MSALINEKELLQWLDYDQPAKVRQWLEQRGIKYAFGKGRKIVTTQAAIDKHFAANDDTGGIDFA